jgi:toxoflavin biosynthesis protein ToxD
MSNMIAVNRIGLGRVAVMLLAGCAMAMLAIVATGCARQNPPKQNPPKQNPPKAEQPMTQGACEAHSGFVFVTGGEFVAGSDRTERDYAYRISAEGFADSAGAVADAEAGYRKQGWFDHEPERQTLHLPPFCMSDQRVTNADYQAFVRATGHPAPGISEADYQRQGFLVHGYAKVVPYLWQHDQYPAGQGQHPVVLIAYEDAVAYANWRSQQDGVSYRLPTKLEWEKAARGTDGRYFPWGSEWRNEATHWAKNGARGTSAIATYPASRSPYGIEDMAGNVFEYTSTLTKAPHPQVILKGCGWDDYPGFCRAAYEHDRPVNSKHILFGFRLVLE